ncbi:MAG: hypothetical protein LUG14_09265 [Synergistaceae bacterium]|nr:hypothetical protein [Synergistaceae bacterium]
MEIKFNKRFDWKELPPISEIEADASRLAKGITVGETLFFREHGVKSEAEYKRRAIAEGLISPSIRMSDGIPGRRRRRILSLSIMS